MKIFQKSLFFFVLLVMLLLPVVYLAAQNVTLRDQVGRLRSTYPNVTDEEVAVIEAVKSAQDSVVSIVIRRELFVPSEKLLDIGNGIQIVVPGELKSQGKQVVGQGSGFVIRGDGLIVTNKHVAGDPKSEYQVVFREGTKRTARILATDPINDIALLKLNGKLPSAARALSLISSAELQIGQTVIAIGNALGELSNTVTKGVVSALNRSILAADGNGGNSEKLVKIIQTDAAINPGNSGGPLLNTRGEVVGINTAVNLGAENVGFAIPAEDIIFALSSYEKNEKIVRPMLGVRYALITPELKRQMNLSFSHGALLIPGDSGEPAVIGATPAARAGLVGGDIILAINGTPVDGDNDLSSLLRNFGVGEKVQLKVWKKATRKQVTVTVQLTELK